MALLQPAVLIGNEKSGSAQGTLGCFAVRKSDGAKVLLSANHVIFDGETKLPMRIGSPSAGSCRCCCVKNIIARATTAGLQENVSVGPPVGSIYVDAAIAQLEPGFSVLNRIAGLNGTDTAGKPLNGYLQGISTAISDGQRAFVCTASSSLPRSIIPCKILHVAEDVTIQGAGTVRTQIVLKVDDGFEQDIVFGSGDSGSIVVDEHNQIIGLMHSRASTTPLAVNSLADLIVASRIALIAQKLGIDIPPEKPPVPHAGALLDDIPQLEGPGISDPELQRYEQLILKTDLGARLHRAGFQHGSEVVHLVHYCRPVTVAWHRGGGPAWAAHIINSSRDATYRIPDTVKGYTQQQFLQRMADVLAKYGSTVLRKDLALHAPTVFDLSGFATVPELLERAGISPADARHSSTDAPLSS